MMVIDKVGQLVEFRLNFFFRISLSFLLVHIIGFAFCQKIVTSGDSLPNDKNLLSGKLENGLTYCIMRNDSPPGKISLRLNVDVGYPDEQDSELGIAHLIEHLGFRSTEHFPGGLRIGLEKLGLTFGTDFNATTGDATSYFMTISSKDSAVLTAGMVSFYDLAGGRRFVEAEINEERFAVVNEISNGNAMSFSALHNQRFQLLGQDRSFQAEVDLQIANVLNVTTENVRAFYDRWYVPNKQMLVIVGDIDIVKVEDQIKRIFSKLERPKRETEVLKGRQPDEVQLSGGDHRYIVVKDPNALDIGVAIYRTRLADSNLLLPSTVTELKRKAIDDMFNRLVRNRLESVKPPDTLAISSLSTHIARRAIIESANVDAMETRFHVRSSGDIKASLQFIQTELRRIVRWGFSSAEVDRAKRQMKYEYSQDLRTSGKLVLLIVRYQTSGARLPADMSEMYYGLLDEINNRDVLDVFSSWLEDEKNLDVVFSCPPSSAEKLPTREEVFKWIQELKDMEVPKLADYSIPVLSYIPRNFTSKKYSRMPSDDMNTMVMKLANGARVVLKSLGSSYKISGGADPGIALRIFKTGGASSYGDKDYASALASASIQAESGLGNLAHPEYVRWKGIRNEVGRVGILPYVTDDEVGIRGGATLNNYEDLLNLVYLHFMQPRKDSSAFFSWRRSERLNAVSRRRSVFVFEDSIGHTIGRNDLAFTAQILDRVDYARSYDIYRDFFSDPSEYTFIIVGFFNPVELMEITNKYIGAINKVGKSRSKSKVLSSPDKTAQVLSRKFKSSENLRAIFVDDSVGNVQVRVLLRCTFEGNPLDEVKLKVANVIFNSLLFSRLREKEKGVYSVFSNLRISTEIDDAVFDVDFEAPPDKVQSLVFSTVDEMNRIAKNDFDEQIFQRAVSVVRTRMTKQMYDPFYWAGQLHGKFSMAASSDLNSGMALLNSLKSGDLSAYMRMCVKLDEYALFKLL